MNSTHSTCRSLSGNICSEFCLSRVSSPLIYNYIIIVGCDVNGLVEWLFLGTILVFWEYTNWWVLQPGCNFNHVVLYSNQTVKSLCRYETSHIRVTAGGPICACPRSLMAHSNPEESGFFPAIMTLSVANWSIYHFSTRCKLHGRWETYIPK